MQNEERRYGDNIEAHKQNGTYYYLVESTCVIGKSRLVKQGYFGTAEHIVVTHIFNGLSSVFGKKLEVLQQMESKSFEING